MRIEFFHIITRYFYIKQTNNWSLCVRYPSRGQSLCVCQNDTFSDESTNLFWKNKNLWNNSIHCDDGFLSDNGGNFRVLHNCNYFQLCRAGEEDAEHSESIRALIVCRPILASHQEMRSQVKAISSEIDSIFLAVIHNPGQWCAWLPLDAHIEMHFFDCLQRQDVDRISMSSDITFKTCGAGGTLEGVNSESYAKFYAAPSGTQGNAKAQNS